jgi:CheY-like chemotaxis protein
VRRAVAPAAARHAVAGAEGAIAVPPPEDRLIRFAADDFGTDHMRSRSHLAKLVRDLPPLSDFLIVDDEEADAKWLVSSLKLVCGHDVRIRLARSLGTALDALKSATPQLVFLDDRISPVDNATTSIPFIRRAGYLGPIVIVSGALTRQRSADLIKLGAAAILHKDDIESARVAEVLIRIFGPGDPV